MAVKLDPTPLKTTLTNKAGFLNPSWVKYMVFLFQRVGGLEAKSNLELAADTTTVTSNVTTLQSEIQMFNQGPNL